MKTGSKALTCLSLIKPVLKRLKSSLVDTCWAPFQECRVERKSTAFSLFVRFSHQLQLLPEADALSDSLSWLDELEAGAVFERATQSPEHPPEPSQAWGAPGEAALSPPPAPGQLELLLLHKDPQTLLGRSKGNLGTRGSGWPILVILLRAEKFKVGKFVCS